MTIVKFKMGTIQHQTHETNIPFANSQLLAKVIQRDIKTSSLPGIAEVYSTVFSADITEAPGPSTFVFDKPTFPFQSNLTPQILVVKIPDLNVNSSPERFKVIGVDYDRPDLVHVAHYEEPDSNGPLLPITGEISNVAGSIMFQFKMSTLEKTEPFGVYLLVRDNETGQTFRCDPQVGNDPPKKGAVPL